MLEQELESKKYNVFVNIAKVFKYDFIAAIRVFLPVCGILIIMGLVNGILVGRYDTEPGTTGSFMTGLCIFLYFMIWIITSIVTHIGIYLRFRNSMVSSEAYLNMTLPVTMFEHISGRALSGLALCIIFTLSGIASVGLFAIRGYSYIAANWGYIADKFNNVMYELNMNAFQFWLEISIVVITSYLFYISVWFIINAIGHLVSKGRTLVKVILFFFLSGVPQNVLQIFSFRLLNADQPLLLVPSFIVAIILAELIFAGIYFTITGLILRYRLSVE